jgi:hypothetical protein
MLQRKADSRFLCRDRANCFVDQILPLSPPNTQAERRQNLKVSIFTSDSVTVLSSRNLIGVMRLSVAEGQGTSAYTVRQNLGKHHTD